MIVPLLAEFISKGQINEFSFKVGVIQSITKTQQIDPTYSFTFSGFDPRTGGVVGVRYSHEISRYIKIGTDMVYVLKGHISDYPTSKVYSNHYLGLTPFIGIRPFANAKSKYISCITPELSFDYNYSIASNANWNLLSNAKFYKNEIGYSVKLTYQPTKLGFQVFHFSSLSPFLKTYWGDPPFEDLKYNFVSGISIIYKFFDSSK